MRVGAEIHAPAALPLGRRLGAHCTGGWVGPSAGSDGCGKISRPPGFDPRAAQPVPRQYTDRAIPAHPIAAGLRKIVTFSKFFFC
jgi:hypothetical protein